MKLESLPRLKELAQAKLPQRSVFRNDTLVNTLWKKRVRLGEQVRDAFYDLQEANNALMTLSYESSGTNLAYNALENAAIELSKRAYKLDEQYKAYTKLEQYARGNFIEPVPAAVKGDDDEVPF